MSSSNRGERIEQLLKSLRKHYKPLPLPEGRSLLEQLVYACCLEDAKFEVADEIFAKLQQSYFDWNEIRVTTVVELSELMSMHPLPVQAAARVKKNLQSIFESRYSYDIDDLKKLNLGKAVEVIEGWGGSSKFVSSFLQQNALGGHTIPTDHATLHALIACGVVTPTEADKGQTPGLDRAVPKAKGIEFFTLLHQFAADYQVDQKNSTVKAIILEVNPEGNKKREEPPKPTPKAAAKPEPPKETPKPKGATPAKEGALKDALAKLSKDKSSGKVSEKAADKAEKPTSKAPPAKSPPAKPTAKQPTKPPAKAPPSKSAPPPAKSAAKPPANKPVSKDTKKGTPAPIKKVVGKGLVKKKPK